MRLLTIFYSNGEILRHCQKGTNPEIQKAFFIGRVINGRSIEALTIENLNR